MNQICGLFCKEKCAGFAFDKGTAGAIENKARAFSWQTYAKELAEALE